MAHETRYFQLHQPMDPSLLLKWAARAFDCDLESARFIERWSNEPASLTITHEQYESGYFCHDYGVRLAHRPISRVEMAHAVQSLVHTHQVWAQAATDERHPYHSLLMTPQGIWTRYDYDEQTAEAVMASRRNTAMGVVCVPDALSGEDVQHVVTQSLGVPMDALEWRSGQVHPYGLTSETDDTYDWPLVEAHLQDPLEVRDAELQQWMPIAQKVERWLDAVERASMMLDVPLYAYHQTFNVVQNIPGGSDSETYCVRVDGHERQQLIFKVRRASW